MNHETRLSWTVLLSMLCACGPAAKDVSLMDELPSVEIQTTHSEIALANLQSEIEALEAMRRRGNPTASGRSRLVDLYSLRVRYLGKYSDFSSMLDLADEAVAAEPTSPSAYLLRAQVKVQLHRFDKALEDLNEAEEHGADPRAVDGRRYVIRVATGAKTPPLVDAATFEQRFAGALALEANDDFVGADTLFVDALTHYRDVSPFVVASVAFARGVMWSERADRPDWGAILYEEALSKLPQYVTANIHLAEIEWNNGDIDAAIQRLEPLRSQTEDPELFGLLGELYADRDDVDRATAMIDRARRAYDALLTQYPLAFADHGAEFFMGPGNDPSRALELAKLNVANRPSNRAHELLSTAMAQF